MKATELYFTVVLFMLLWKVVGEIQKCDHSTES